MLEEQQHYPSDTFGPLKAIATLNEAPEIEGGIEMFHLPGETLFGPVAMPMRELVGSCPAR